MVAHSQDDSGPSQAETVPIDFRTRNFCDRIDFLSGESFYVSGIASDLHIVKLKDVNKALCSFSTTYSIPNRRIKVFTQKEHTVIRGVSKFTDSDYVIVYSTRYLAVIDPHEITQLFREDRSHSTSLCRLRTVQLTEDIISLQCLHKSIIAITFPSEHKQVVLVYNSSLDAFSIRNKNPPTNFGFGSKSVITTASTAIVNEGYCIFCAFKGGKVEGVLPSRKHRFPPDPHKPDVFATEAKSLCVATDATLRTPENVLIQLSEKSLSSCSFQTYKKNIISRHSLCRSDFLSEFYFYPLTGNVTDLDLRAATLTRGSLLLYKPWMSPSTVERFDVLLSSDLTHFQFDRGGATMLTCGQDSSWIAQPALSNESPVLIDLPNLSIESLFVFGDTVYAFDRQHGMMVFKYANGVRTLVRHISGVFLGDDWFERAQPASSNSNYHRVVFWTDGIMKVIDLGADPLVQYFHRMNGSWAISLRRDLLVLFPTGQMILLNEHAHIMGTFQFPHEEACDNPILMHRFAIVRRTKAGNKCGILIAFQMDILHVVFEISDLSLLDIDKAKPSQMHRTPVYGSGSTNAYCSQKDLSTEADNVPIADIVLRVGGRLTVLLDNGTLVEYDLAIKGTEFVFGFLCSRRVECLGLNIIDTPKGTFIMGMINDYKHSREKARSIQDNTTTMYKAYEKMNTTRDLSTSLAALIDPSTSTILSQTEYWDLGVHHTNAVVFDTNSRTMHQILIDRGQAPGKKRKSNGYREYAHPIQFPVHLSQVRPPGNFVGMDFAKIDSRYYLVVMGNLNVHVYLLDVRTGSMHEAGVIGWENGNAAPTLSMASKGSAIMTVRTMLKFENIQIILKQCPVNGYSVSFIPIHRAPIDDSYKRIILPGLYSNGTNMQSTFSMKMQVRQVSPPNIVFLEEPNENWCINLMEATHTSADNRNMHSYFTTAPIRRDQESFPHIVFNKCCSLPHNPNRQFIGLPDEPILFTVEVSPNGQMIFSRLDQKAFRKPFTLPVNGISQLQYAAEQHLVYFATTDGTNTSRLHFVKVLPNGHIVNEQNITLPFRPIKGMERLFVRVSEKGKRHFIYVYRLMGNTNHLDAVRVDIDHTTKLTHVEYTLPPINLEMAPIDSFCRFQIYFVGSEFLFVNDGPRMLRICECCRKYYDDSPITEEMKNSVHQ